ncbi:MAG: phosphoadenosine phosphosulfate reductase family protein [Pseudomonadota bacterium]
MSTVLYESIRTAALMSSDCLVSFSGGKDSVVVLSLCLKYFKKVEAFFMYTVPKLSFYEQIIKYYEHRFKIRIHQCPHYFLSGWLKYGTYRGKTDLNVPILSLNDIYNYFREKTGIFWIAGGERIQDSFHRRGIIKNTGTIDKKRGRFFPVAYWTTREILHYMKVNRLHRDKSSLLLGRSYGCELEGSLFIKLKEKFPDDWKRFTNFYPLIEAVIVREQNGNKQISEV